MSERVAILVIHGIGEEEPYGTLDQFARGLHQSLQAAQQDWTIQPDLDRVKDPTHAEKSWVRAFLRFMPKNGTPLPFESDKQKAIESVTLFEYYWAPITKDKVAYTTSIWFLIQAGLQPFRYWAANVSAISSASRRQRAREIAGVAWREFLRQLCIFLPLLAFLATLLIWLGDGSALKALKALGDGDDASSILGLALVAIRFLFLYSGVKALSESFSITEGWQRSWLWRSPLILILLFNLIFWPYFFPTCLTWLADWISSFPICLHGDVTPATVAASINSFAQGFTVASVAAPRKNTFWDYLGQFLLLRPTLERYIGLILSLILANIVRFILITYVGDVAVYCNPNRLSKNYAARAQVLDECIAALGSILLEVDPQGAPVYNRVLIAAHSLGSVIAYDALNQLLNLARTAPAPGGTPRCLQPSDLRRINGLLTFGSPLNKIFYFFRELGDPAATLRHQTLDLLHGFRLNPAVTPQSPTPPFDRTADPLNWKDATEALAANFTWINAYAPLDPISGKLIFYRLGKTDVAGAPVGDPAGAQRSLPLRIPLLAHNMYWSDPEFYRFFRDNLL